MSEDIEFGGAKLSALMRARERGAAVLSIADAGTREDFYDKWIQRLSAYARRMQASGTALTAPITVVHLDDCTPMAQRSHWQKRTTLGASEHDDLQGILAVSTGSVGGYVFGLRLPAPERIENTIIAEDLGSRPTMMLADSTKLLIWPNGLRADEPPIEREFQTRAVVVSFGTIDHQLSRFYELVARDCKRWWKDAPRYIVQEQPESRVQLELWGFLISAFGDVARVKQEETIGNGRADITIWPHETSVNESAVLELKTVRDYMTPKEEKEKPTKINEKQNTSWALSGVQQTAAYRDHEHMGSAFLCVYDFRKTNCDEILKAIDATAKQYDVATRRYWVTASHTAHRDDRYPPSEEAH